jgi:hypothetical protein
MANMISSLEAFSLLNKWKEEETFIRVVFLRPRSLAFILRNGKIKQIVGTKVMAVENSGSYLIFDLAIGRFSYLENRELPTHLSLPPEFTATGSILKFEWNSDESCIFSELAINMTETI